MTVKSSAEQSPTYTTQPTATVQVDINLPAVQDWFKKPDKK
jgi:hypothetical protein